MLRAAAIPALPAAHEGQQITWRPWRDAVVAACGRRAAPRACSMCGAPGPLLFASGSVGAPAVVRAYGHHCTSCRETRVYWRPDPPPGTWSTRLVRIAYHPPRTEGPK